MVRGGKKAHDKGKMTVRHLPPSVKEEFRARCKSRGHRMNDVVAALMRLYVEFPGKVRVLKRAWKQRYVPPRGGRKRGHWTDEEE
jgi:hypothetical protein